MSATPPPPSTVLDPGRHVWGMGRHFAGSNFYWYLADPAGSFIELYSDLDQILDDEAWECRGPHGVLPSSTSPTPGDPTSRSSSSCPTTSAPCRTAGSAGRRERRGRRRRPGGRRVRAHRCGTRRTLRPTRAVGRGRRTRHRDLPVAACRAVRPRGAADPPGAWLRRRGAGGVGPQRRHLVPDRRPTHPPVGVGAPDGRHGLAVVGLLPPADLRGILRDAVDSRRRRPCTPASRWWR